MWSDAVITNAGKALLASWAGGGTLNIDSAKAGTGTVAVASLMAQTALVSEKQTMSIISKESVASGIRLKLQITSTGVTTSYTLNQIGVWASLNGGSSTLLALFQDDTGITVPTYASMPDFVFTFYAILQMSNSGTMTVNIDASAVVTQSTLDTAIAGHSSDENAHSVLFASAISTAAADATAKANAAENASVPKSVATAADQVLVSTGVGAWGVKTLAQFKTWLALAATNISDFAATVRSTALTGLSTATSTAVTAADTVLSALGKLQAQITANLSTLTSHTGSTSNPHGVTAAQAGAAPTSRTVNGKALSSDISLTYSDVGAAASSHSHAASAVTAGTLGGQVVANATAVATTGTAQVRNIYVGTSDMTAGSTSLTTGNLYFMYE